MKATVLAAALATSAMLGGCSQPFALADGCYYADDGKPILRVHGEDGIILTPEPRPGPNQETPIHRVHLSPRVNRDGAYVDVYPGFYLTDSGGAATSSPTARFAIDTRGTTPAIMVNMEAWGEEPVRLGRPC